MHDVSNSELRLCEMTKKRVIFGIIYQGNQVIRLTLVQTNIFIRTRVSNTYGSEPWHASASCRLLFPHQFPHKKIRNRLIYFHYIFILHKVVRIVYDHQCFQGHFLAFQPFYQIRALAELYIPVVISVNDQYG